MQAVAEMRAAGKAEEDIESFSHLFTECQKQVDSKQLRPFVRTQYMRTAFQIPFDATVRISLDTNLTMLKEGIEDGRPLERWCCPPSPLRPSSALPVSRSCLGCDQQGLAGCVCVHVAVCRQKNLRFHVLAAITRHVTAKGSARRALKHGRACQRSGAGSATQSKSWCGRTSRASRTLCSR